jgi:hypothetical protein
MAFKTSTGTSNEGKKDMVGTESRTPTYQLRLSDQDGSTYVSLFRCDTKDGKNFFFAGNTRNKKDDGTYENGQESFFFMPKKDGGEIRFRQAAGGDIATLCVMKPSDKEPGSFFGGNDTGLKCYLDTWEAAKKRRAEYKASKAAAE